MATSKQQEQDRKARVAAMQAKQRGRQLRRDGLLFGSVALVVAGLIASFAVVIIREQRRQADAEAAANRPISGIKEFPGLPRNHVQQPVSYPQTPAVGGDHSSVWQNCGMYTSPVPAEQAVHSLEHGAVWIGYRPGLAAAQVAQLSELAEANSYVLLSPVDGVASPVVASAWGRQLALDSASDPRLATFVRAHQQGSDAPEPGAPCTGGAGAP